MVGKIFELYKRTICAKSGDSIVLLFDWYSYFQHNMQNSQEGLPCCRNIAAQNKVSIDFTTKLPPLPGVMSRFGNIAAQNKVSIESQHYRSGHTTCPPPHTPSV